MAVREFKRKPEPSVEHRSFSKPDETRKFDLGKVDIVSLGGTTFGRAVFEPGWRWSTCVKPIAKTASCEIATPESSHFRAAARGDGQRHGIRIRSRRN